SVPLRYAGFANAAIKLNDQWIINPNVYYTTQARSTEVVGGLMAQYNLSGDGETQLIGGAYYRYNDAVVAMIGLELKGIRLTFTYDATTSSLKNYNNGLGGLEFSLIKYGSYFDNSAARDVRCPSFKN
ncbi:MAG: type IX secretion system membrane protein PorP/SprF, partial [Sphingobacteriaceae bacterium]